MRVRCWSPAWRGAAGGRTWRRGGGREETGTRGGGAGAEIRAGGGVGAGAGGIAGKIQWLEPCGCKSYAIISGPLTVKVVTGEGAEVEVEGIAGTREVEAGGKEGGQENNITWEKTLKM